MLFITRLFSFKKKAKIKNKAKKCIRGRILKKGHQTTFTVKLIFAGIFFLYQLFPVYLIFSKCT